ncbi:MAG: hypothetical protein KF824_11515 [Fimbriimonadaceae bacterium]|nr:MAG: hypothetical protein KF824_11515 [Fimbriimonadaceae bacterium]
MIQGEPLCAVIKGEELHLVPIKGAQIVEGFSNGDYLICKCEIEKGEKDKAWLQVVSGTSSTRIEYDLNFLNSRHQVQIKKSYYKYKGFAIGAGQTAIAVELSKAIDLGESIELILQEEGHELEVQATVAKCTPRGKGFLVVATLADMSRVTTMYWNRLLKTG